MATYEVEAPDGSILTIEGPEGATDEQLINVAREQFEAIPVEAAPIEEAPQDTAATDEITRQLGLTIRAGAEGAGSILGIFSDPIAAALNQALPEDQQLTYASETVSNLLSRMGVPEPESKGERIVQEASQALVGGGGTVAIARQAARAAATPVTQAVADILAVSPEQQLAGAALAGAAGQAAAEEGVGIPGQVAASLAGGLTGAKLAAPRAAARITPAAPVIEEAERAGVRVLTSDVIPPRNFAAKWLRRVGEQIPIAGTGRAREAQQAQRIASVRNVLRDFGADDVSQLSDDVMADLMVKRSKDLTKYSKMKGDVIEKVSAAGGAVNVNRATAEIDGQIAKLESLGTKEVQPVIERLNDFKDAIFGQNLDNVEMLRKQLGESFKAPELTSVRGLGEKAAGGIYKALKKDMGDFIKEFGEVRDLTKWKVADNRLSGMIGDLKASAFKSALNRGAVTPEVVKTMLLSKKKSDVIRLYGSLTPEGRRNARGALLQEAAAKAVNKDGVIIPDKFTSELKRQKIGFDVFFRGDDKQAVEGLNRVLDATARAGQAGLLPETGAQLALPVGAAVLTDLMGGAGAALATGSVVGLMARAYESKPVRNALLKLATMKKGSTEEAKEIARFVAAYQAQRELSEEIK